MGKQTKDVLQAFIPAGIIVGIIVALIIIILLLLKYTNLLDSMKDPQYHKNGNTKQQTPKSTRISSS